MKIDTGNPESLASSLSSGVSREFHSFLADIEDLVRDATSLTGDDLAKAKAKLNARVAAARESVEEVSDAVVSRARKTAKATDQYVHEQPWKVIGISAAVAFLVGFALARRD
jgi:ElaB/YqjD/DUF883 family membrane-anchored ribosome-binding protein